jgi:hypothetical protein
MHQQPPHMPLCFSTSRAKSGQVVSSSGLVWKPVKICSFTGFLPFPFRGLDSALDDAVLQAAERQPVWFSWTLSFPTF